MLCLSLSPAHLLLSVETMFSKIQSNFITLRLLPVHSFELCITSASLMHFFTFTGFTVMGNSPWNCKISTIALSFQVVSFCFMFDAHPPWYFTCNQERLTSTTGQMSSETKFWKPCCIALFEVYVGNLIII